MEAVKIIKYFMMISFLFSICIFDSDIMSMSVFRTVIQVKRKNEQEQKEIPFILALSMSVKKTHAEILDSREDLSDISVKLARINVQIGGSALDVHTHIPCDIHRSIKMI